MTDAEFLKQLPRNVTGTGNVGLLVSQYNRLMALAERGSAVQAEELRVRRMLGDPIKGFCLPLSEPETKNG